MVLFSLPPVVVFFGGAKKFSMRSGPGDHHVESNKSRFEVKFRLPKWLPLWLRPTKPKFSGVRRDVKQRG